MWTHNICMECWYKLFDFTPTRINDPEEETCCFCGKKNTEGIYVRKDPNSFQCKGDHR